VVAAAPPAAAGANGAEAHQTAEPRPIPAVRVIDVPLPITGLIDNAVKGQLARFREQTAQHAVPGVRPVVVLRLSGEGSNTGAGSEFERCLSLARYVASDALSGLRTVAYVRGKVEGHAV